MNNIQKQKIKLLLSKLIFIFLRTFLKSLILIRKNTIRIINAQKIFQNIRKIKFFKIIILQQSQKKKIFKKKIYFFFK